MKMSYEELEKKRLLRRHTFTKRQIRQQIDLARRDLKVAKDNLKNKNYDWTYAIAYNAILQSARALLFSKGYRPVGEDQHKTVIEALKREFGESSDLPNRANRMRKRRHKVVYSLSGMISEIGANEALKLAEQIVQRYC
jgi:uncharacterized protein (UPF0332 family)